MSRTQEPPFCIQIELSEGCNLYCGFCGLQGIREKAVKNFKFMEESTLRTLLRQVAALGWNPRIEFAMHGEPTMHPDYVGMIRAAREEAPRLHIMMTSNGGGLVRKPGPRENVLGLFQAGLNVLALDEYTGIGFVGKVREALVGHAEPSILIGHGVPYGDGELLDVHEYPRDPAGNPHRRGSNRRRMLSFVEDIEKAGKGTHAVITNHAGSGGPTLAEPLQEQCAKPFREIGIRYDGAMAMCCNDWRGVYKVGNVRDTDVGALWNSPAMQAARALLYAKDRDFGACKGCDYHTYRNGLLPDKMGRETLPPPTAEDRAEVARACAGEPYATPVLRPWEQK